MHLQVLGSGCPACHKLFETTQKAVEELGLDARLEFISGDEATHKIIELGVMTSPVLLIDGKVAMTGATTRVDKVKAVLVKGADEQPSSCKSCCGGAGCDCGGKC